VLGRVLTKVREDRRGRPFRCAFINLTDPDEAVFNKHDWLRCATRWVERKMRISLYKSLCCVSGFVGEIDSLGTFIVFGA
jgi:hypothetical protein